MQKKNVKKVIILLLFGLVSSLFVVAVPEQVSACSCIQPGSPTEEMEKSAAVFSGKVLSVDQRDFQYIVTFAVTTSWKGVSEKTVVVSTALDSAACGIGFDVGEQYLVYAYQNEDTTLGTGLCSRTQLLSGAEADVSALGEGNSISPSAPEGPGQQGTPGGGSDVSPVLVVSIILIEILIVVALYYVAHAIIVSRRKSS